MHPHPHPSFKAATVVLVADTVDFEVLAEEKPDEAMMSFENILTRINQNDYWYHAWVAVRKARALGGDMGIMTELALDIFLVELGLAILDRIPGRLYFPVDPRLADNTEALIKKGHTIIALFHQKETSRERVVLNIPATNEGILAARNLEHDGDIRTNLTHTFSLLHAAACAEARPSTISICVGGVLDWFERTMRGPHPPSLNENPGVESVQSIVRYFEGNEVPVNLMGTDFIHAQGVRPYTGLTRVCLSPRILYALRHRSSPPFDARPGVDSIPELRARQAKYPTSFLKHPDGIGAEMSQSTRRMVEINLSKRIGMMCKDILELERLIEEELRRQETISNSVFPGRG